MEILKNFSGLHKLGTESFIVVYPSIDIFHSTFHSGADVGRLAMKARGRSKRQKMSDTVKSLLTLSSEFICPLELLNWR